eukprot:TRINITY_DN8983_c0_g1_i1.p1 TRINITY_DN8983_c0_g1~~TRINITY_DN8983_c0_g1_i1.p1  ORF type:complete len:334 (-),score=47.37 TRINITY_DN8983_c0_g1_i1:723-1724(-)
MSKLSAKIAQLADFPTTIKAAQQLDDKESDNYPGLDVTPSGTQEEFQLRPLTQKEFEWVNDFVTITWLRNLTFNMSQFAPGLLIDLQSKDIGSLSRLDVQYFKRWYDAGRHRGYFSFEYMGEKLLREESSKDVLATWIKSTHPAVFYAIVTSYNTMPEAEQVKMMSAKKTTEKLPFIACFVGTKLESLRNLARVHGISESDLEQIGTDRAKLCRRLEDAGITPSLFWSINSRVNPVSQEKELSEMEAFEKTRKKFKEDGSEDTAATAEYTAKYDKYYSKRVPGLTTNAYQNYGKRLSGVTNGDGSGRKRMRAFAGAKPDAVAEYVKDFVTGNA